MTRAKVILLKKSKPYSKIKSYNMSNKARARIGTHYIAIEEMAQQFDSPVHDLNVQKFLQGIGDANKT